MMNLKGVHETFPPRPPKNEHVQNQGVLRSKNGMVNRKLDASLTSDFLAMYRCTSECVDLKIPAKCLVRFLRHTFEILTKFEYRISRIEIVTLVQPNTNQALSPGRWT